MSMRRNPLYVFNNEASLGIFDIPIDSIIQVVDSDGVQTPSMTLIIGKNNLTQSSNIRDYLNRPQNYKELDRYTESLNELSDVNIDPFTIGVGRILVYDGFNWIDAPPTALVGGIKLGDLQDVPDPAGNDGYHLEWDDTTQLWQLVAVVKNLNDLGDVDTSTTPPTMGKVLTFDGSEWSPTDIDGGIYIG